jgi:REP element-mobilizing transposase RayT
MHVHLVFSTKHRLPIIIEAVRLPLHGYFASILNNLGCPVSLVNSVEDHVHILFELDRSISLSKAVGEAKRYSSHWMKAQDKCLSEFAWQSGYGAFSVSESRAQVVRAYIADQREHHRTASFQEELRTILLRHRLAFDESHLWE